MSFYIIYNRDTIKIHSDYFEIFNTKICYKIDTFNIYNYDKKFSVYVLVYEYNDFFTYFRLLDAGVLNLKVVIVNPYFKKILKRTINIFYVDIYRFQKDITKFIGTDNKKTLYTI